MSEWNKAIEAAAKAIDDRRAYEAGLWDKEHSGQRGEDRSNALYDALKVVRALARPAGDVEVGVGEREKQAVEQILDMVLSRKSEPGTYRERAERIVASLASRSVQSSTAETKP